MNIFLFLFLSTIRNTIQHQDPFSITAHYLNKSIENKEAIFTVKYLNKSKSMSNVQITVSQEDKIRCQFIGIFGDFNYLKGPSFKQKVAPILPPLDECIDAGSIIKKAFGDKLKIQNTFELMIPKSDPFNILALSKKIGTTASISGYVRFNDNRPHCFRSLSFFCDALPPPILNIHPTSWVPTLEFTTHFWKLPHKTENNWIRFKFDVDYMENGLLYESGQLWDYSGEILLATSRQIARILVVSSK